VLNFLLHVIPLIKYSPENKNMRDEVASVGALKTVYNFSVFYLLNRVV